MCDLLYKIIDINTIVHDIEDIEINNKIIFNFKDNTYKQKVTHTNFKSKPVVKNNKIVNDVNELRLTYTLMILLEVYDLVKSIYYYIEIIVAFNIEKSNNPEGITLDNIESVEYEIKNVYSNI